MSRNGSGVYSLPAGQPVVTGTTISSAAHNALMSDIATEITRSIASDGQTTPTANLPMGGFKFTGLAAGSVSGDSARYDELITKASLSGALFSGAVGYGSGAGGTVTQSTSKSTAVTLNKPCGTITMHAAALAPGVAVEFVFNNSVIASTDLLLVHFGGGVSSQFNYRLSVHLNSIGAATIALINTSAGTLSEAIILKFAVIKGVTA